MFQSKKPYSSITVAVETLTGEQYEEDDVGGIPELVESIKLQSTGPTEAARAIRKKLKYGNVHRQLRALTLLDGLIQNAGAQFQRTVADEMLLERLRVCGTSDLSDPAVQTKCKELFRSWAVEYKNTRGLEKIAALHKELPRRKQVVTQAKSRVLRETEQNPFSGDEESTPAPSSSRPESHAKPWTSESARVDALMTGRPFLGTKSKKNKESDKEKKNNKKKGQAFNLEAEKDNMKTCIAESNIAATNLLNALRLINREQEQISENKNVVAHFENCKLLRRKVLRYIQHVDSEEWLGSLLHANDDLVTALMTFEQLDRSIDADSDSDDELAEQAHMYKLISEKGKENEAAQKFAGMTLHTNNKSPVQAPNRPPKKAPAPPAPPVEDDEDSFEEEDENDPFADRNAVTTPKVERGEPAWRVV